MQLCSFPKSRLCSYKIGGWHQRDGRAGSSRTSHHTSTATVSPSANENGAAIRATTLQISGETGMNLAAIEEGEAVLFTGSVDASSARAATTVFH